jgi:hypothetical protein
MIFFNPEGAKIRLLVCKAHTEHEAPARNHIERDDVLGHVEGMMQRQQQDRSADLNSLGPRCDCATDDQWGWQKSVLVLMMLAKEKAVEAAIFGQLRLGYGFLNAAVEIVAARGVCDRTVKPKLDHGLSFRWLNKFLSHGTAKCLGGV